LVDQCGDPQSNRNQFGFASALANQTQLIQNNRNINEATKLILMSKYVIDVPATVSLPVVGSDQTFPVRRVYCIGRNYAAHAIEMGHDPDREPPFFFQKNPNNLDTTGKFPYPPKTSDVHHEIEMAVN